MNIIKTDIEGLLIIEPRVFKDNRGYFYESYNEELFVKNGISNTFVQDNESASTKGVLRGLHYQCEGFAQTKLVRVIRGEVQDVAVDLRKDSPTYGKHHSIILSEENKRQFLIPKGFAHGFLVLSDFAIFSYKCDQVYHKDSEGGLMYNDPQLGIQWLLPESELILSEKDMVQPTLGNNRPILSPLLKDSLLSNS